jgi:hypothetical protein
MSKRLIAKELATALLGGPWSPDEFHQRLTQAWGKRDRWLRPFTGRAFSAFPAAEGSPSLEALTAWLERDRGFRRRWAAWPIIVPQQRALVWPTPRLQCPDALATWLGLTGPELDWFAGCAAREQRVPVGPLRHYHYRWVAKSAGRWRLLEIPKRRLKAIQRQVLHEILDPIPPHDAVHSFRAGRSVATYAAPHCGQRLVLRMDLRDFFPTIGRARVRSLFQSAGYSDAIARLLAGLCTNALPRDVFRAAPLEHGTRQAWEQELLYSRAHVPQGAPTSPALGNLSGYRLDCRLAGLARVVGARYTRYADDLTFSGGRKFERCVGRFHVYVCRVALEEGFEIQTRKTRVQRRSVRQRVAGVVVNVRPNIARTEFDRLKAVLFNCARHGPTSQNREGRSDFRAHLLGRIGYVRMLNPDRGRRLLDLFERIPWPAAVPPSHS